MANTSSVIVLVGNTDFYWSGDVVSGNSKISVSESIYRHDIGNDSVANVTFDVVSGNSKISVSESIYRHDIGNDSVANNDFETYVADSYTAGAAEKEYWS